MPHQEEKGMALRLRLPLKIPDPRRHDVHAATLIDLELRASGFALDVRDIVVHRSVASLDKARRREEGLLQGVQDLQLDLALDVVLEPASRGDLAF